jgi:hypothetical protein
MKRLLQVSVLMSLLVLSLSAGVAQERERAATPQRPSFSNNAGTTYPRSVELEAGFSIDEDLVDTPTILKYGFTDNLEGFFAVSPFVRREIGPFSDTEAFERATVGVKYRLQDPGAGIPALAIQVSTTEFENFAFFGIYTQELQTYTLDANVGLTFNGGTTLTGIATFSRTLNPQIGVFGEAVLENNFDRNDLVVLLGAGGSLSQNPLYVWDAALHLGLLNAGFTIRLQLGLTANLGLLQP